MSVVKIKPKLEASAGTVLDNMIIPATKVTPATPRTRAMGSLSVRMTIASTVLMLATSVSRMKMLERNETAGESRPTRKTKYIPSPANGMRSVMIRRSVMTEASTIRSAPFQRPGVGSRSCQRRAVQVDRIVVIGATSRL